MGIREAYNSDYIILLNSDTIVTNGWIEKMIVAFENNPKIGILSPLSNAATYQNIPTLKGNIGNKINSLPDRIKSRSNKQSG